MKRREFVGWMSMGGIVTSVVSCASNTDSNAQPETTPSGEFQMVGTVQELEETGSLIDEAAGVIVVRNKSQQLIALDISCPHQGCNVALTEGGERLACPCHGSEFTLRGQVLQGPARTKLDNYEVKTEEDQVLVKLESA